MDDLTATRLCAEAMNYIHGGMWERKTQPTAITVTMPEDPTIEARYDPLHDDAQCFALVKRFKLSIESHCYDATWATNDKGWEVEHNDGEQSSIHLDFDLNRAVVFAVAKMWAAKVAAIRDRSDKK